MKKYLAFFATVLVCICMMACGSPAEGETPTDTPTTAPTKAPTEAPTATFTPTPEPIATSTPTPEPTATSTPTPEPTATSTPTPEPTATSTPVPTEAPVETPVATEAPQPTAAPTELSDDIYSFQVQMDGAIYQFPMWYSDFAAMGWTYADEEFSLQPNQYSYSSKWKKGEASLSTRFFNFTINTAALEECAVDGISLDRYELQKNPISVVLPKGITVGVATLDDILAAYGKPTYEYDGSLYHQLEYQLSSYQSVVLEVYKESGVLEEIAIHNMTELAGGNNTVSAAVPDYVVNYTTPDSAEDTAYNTICDIDGVLYQLPCPVSEFLKYGFAISDDYVDSALAAQSSGTINLRYKNMTIICKISNFTDYATVLSNCFVTELSADSYQQKLNMTFLGTIRIGMTKADVLKVVEAYNYETYESTYSSSYTVCEPGGDDYYLSYYMYFNEDDVLSTMRLINRCTPEYGTGAPTDQMAEIQKPADTTDNIFSYQMTIDGEVYQFPMWYSDFAAKGWNFKEDATKTLKPNSYDSILTWEKDGVKIYTDFCNLTINVAPLSECLVAGISFDKMYLDGHDMKVELPGGIQLGVSTTEDILAAYGTPSSDYDSDLYYKMTYRQDTYQYVELYVYKKSGVLEEVDLRNMVEIEGGNNAVSYEVPAEVLAYQAPADNSDIYQMAFALDGALYRLPCPVDEFLKNGFTLDPEYAGAVVPAMSESYSIRFLYGNTPVTCHVYNFSDKATTVENCFVVTFGSSSSGSDLNLNILGNISLGSEKTALFEALATFNYEVASYDPNYITVWNPDGKRTNSCQITLKNDVVIRIDLTNYVLAE